MMLEVAIVAVILAVVVFAYLAGYAKGTYDSARVRAANDGLRKFDDKINHDMQLW